MTFSEKIVKLRKSKGITQDAFAAYVGVSRQAVYKWESGQSDPGIAHLKKIQELFGISFDELLDDSIEITVPEKKKLSRAKREKIEREVKLEEGIVENESPAKEPENEPAPELEAAPKDAPEAEEAPEAKEEAPKKKGFWARLFGR